MIRNVKDVAIFRIRQHSILKQLVDLVDDYTHRRMELVTSQGVK